MDDQIRRELRFLKGYALVATALLATLSLAAFQTARKTRFAEIDVERINVVEPDGKLRMVISNKPRSIGPIYKGKPFGYPGGTRPGMIFFNDEGTENGGMTLSGQRNADGTYSAVSHFSFDQFDQDQILYFQYVDEAGRRRVGFTVADRADVNIFDVATQYEAIKKMPEGPARTEAMQKLSAPRNGVPMFAQRVYVGRDTAKAAVVNLSAPDGKPRLRLQVDSLGVPSVEFLDAAGHVTARLPEAPR